MIVAQRCQALHNNTCLSSTDKAGSRNVRSEQWAGYKSWWCTDRAPCHTPRCCSEPSGPDSCRRRRSSAPPRRHPSPPARTPGRNSSLRGFGRRRRRHLFDPSWPSSSQYNASDPRRHKRCCNKRRRRRTCCGTNCCPGRPGRSADSWAAVVFRPANPSARRRRQAHPRADRRRRRRRHRRPNRRRLPRARHHRTRHREPPARRWRQVKCRSNSRRVLVVRPKLAGRSRIFGTPPRDKTDRQQMTAESKLGSLGWTAPPN